MKKWKLKDTIHFVNLTSCDKACKKKKLVELEFVRPDLSDSVLFPLSCATFLLFFLTLNAKCFKKNATLLVSDI